MTEMTAHLDNSGRDMYTLQDKNISGQFANNQKYSQSLCFSGKKLFLIRSGKF